MNKQYNLFLDLSFWRKTIFASFKKFNPIEQIRKPIIFMVYIAAIWVSILSFLNFSFYNLNLAIWFWITVLYANFAEALAEGRCKAQTDTLCKMRSQTIARKIENGNEIKILASALKSGDIVLCEAGDIIPADGEVIEGIATVDESAITGESAPVIRESGGDRSAVTGGTRVISDKIIIKISYEPGNSFLDKMISLIENTKRRKTPNEQALNILLIALSILFIVIVAVLPICAHFCQKISHNSETIKIDTPTLLSLLICLIPTTIGSLLSAIGISGINRLMRHNVLAMSGRAVEAAGDIDVLLLDKTGTITLGNRMATDFIPAPEISKKNLADVAQLSSLADETPEGRSIVVLAKELYGFRGRDVSTTHANFIPFSSHTRMSGVDLITPHGQILRKIRKGAAETMRNYIIEQGGEYPSFIATNVEHISRSGGTPIIVAENNKILGIVHLKDIIKGGIKERFLQLRKMGIKTVMITGDNPLTAAAIAAEAGVDDFMAEAKPETKLERIKKEQAQGHMVAMIGDGTNDAPAIAQADVGVAMHTGTQAAREAGNMVDLDSNPTKLLDIVETGKQILMTRGSLTTFSIANDIAKYFAILPVIFHGLYATNINGVAITNSPLIRLNIMHLHSPQSAILSAVIFNALIIIILIPLALRGVTYRAIGATALLNYNLFIYGLGGVIAPFIGIKIIDMILLWLF